MERTLAVFWLTLSLPALLSVWQHRTASGTPSMWRIRYAFYLENAAWNTHVPLANRERGHVDLPQVDKLI